MDAAERGADGAAQTGLDGGAAAPPLAATAALVAIAVAARAWTALTPWGLGQDACTFLETARDLAAGAVGAEHWPFRMKHPAYSLLIAGGGAAGIGFELTARLISIAASALLVGLVHRTWSRWRGHGEGAVAAFLLSIHPGLALYGGEIWVEPAQMLLLFLALAGCVRLWDAPRPAARAALVGLAFGLMTCFKNNAVFFVPGAAIALLLPWRTGLPARRVVTTGLVFASVLLPVAFAPQIAEHLVRGSVTPIVIAPDPRMLDPEDHWVVTAAPGADGRLAAILGSSWRRLLEEVLPRSVFPWWIVTPLLLLGAIGLFRGGGRARRFAWIAALSIGLEWIAMTFFGIQDRFLLPGQIALLPVCAAGCSELRRRTASTHPALRAAAPIALLALSAIWLRSFVKTNAANAGAVNGYRDAGRLLAAPGAERPRRLFTTTSEIAWYPAIDHRTFAGATWPEVDAAMRRAECDGLVVGPKESSNCPDLLEASAVPVGGSWRGLRVVVATAGAERVAVLIR